MLPNRADVDKNQRLLYSSTLAKLRVFHLTQHSYDFAHTTHIARPLIKRRRILFWWQIEYSLHRMHYTILQTSFKYNIWQNRHIGELMPFYYSNTRLRTIQQPKKKFGTNEKKSGEEEHREWRQSRTQADKAHHCVSRITSLGPIVSRV